MTHPTRNARLKHHNRRGWWLLCAAFVVTLAVYWPGLSGGFLFDDYPNIVENHGVQPPDTRFSSLVGAALSSPSSELKRPLASLSFAANYLVTGLNPFWMKLTNLIIHLLNGLLVFLLARALLLATSLREQSLSARASSSAMRSRSDDEKSGKVRTKSVPAEPTTNMGYVVRRAGTLASLIAGCWMLLPINLTGVLYVVQRMESMANLFVLIGLIGYTAGRRHMLAACPSRKSITGPRLGIAGTMRGFLICVASITVPVALGIMAKETAVMLPLYALLLEWILFGFRHNLTKGVSGTTVRSRLDKRVVVLFFVVLFLPMVAGLSWLLPSVLNAETWASRDFTLTTRLLSESRIIVDYLVWTLLPTPDALSFYHDDFRISSGLLTPWTTLASIMFLAGLLAFMMWLRRRQPLAALGIALFLGCQLLTGTILPLELIYEHRNYFASFGLLLAIVPLLAAPSSHRMEADSDVVKPTSAIDGLPMALPRYTLLVGLILFWITLTAVTAYSWGNPMRLAEDLAIRAPQSPRAQYELGRTYIISSHYDASSPFIRLAYAPLERAAALPGASILPEQALIFMNARMHLPQKDAWWLSLISKLQARPAGVQDESSLGALTKCAEEDHCQLSRDYMIRAFLAALAHPDPSARLLATYGDYAWNILDDHSLGEQMTRAAVSASPDEPAYQITLVRMLAAQGRKAEADSAIKKLERLNLGGRLNNNLAQLRSLPNIQ